MNRVCVTVNKINRNMRCIEIIRVEFRHSAVALINRNMRCIEIIPAYNRGMPSSVINRNMRCIEINLFDFVVRHVLGLIET